MNRRNALISALLVLFTASALAPADIRVSSGAATETDRSVKLGCQPTLTSACDEISTVSYAYLTELFGYLAASREIPFRYPENFCHARAHAMARFLDKRGLISQKVFVVGDLRAESPWAEWGVVQWKYHVASVLRAVKPRTDTTPETEDVYVLDPSLFDRPVSVAEWAGRLVAHQPDQKYEVYFTPRFNYGPADRKTRFSEYNSIHLIDMYRSLEEGMKIQEARERKRAAARPAS